jgi:hypothetical protein
MMCLPVVVLHGVAGLKSPFEMQLGRSFVGFQPSWPCEMSFASWKEEVVAQGDLARLK